MNHKKHALRDKSGQKYCCPCVVDFVRTTFTRPFPFKTGEGPIDCLAAGDCGIMDTLVEEALLSTIRNDNALCVLSRVDSFDLNKEAIKYDFDEDDNGSEDQMPETTIHGCESRIIIKESEALKSIKPCQQYNRKCLELLRTLSHDLNVIDFKISLYITACNNVRLIPYPEHIVDESPEGLHGLTQINDVIPPVKFLRTFLDRSNHLQLHEHVVNLVHWLTVQLRQPKMVEIPVENFESVFQRIQYVVNIDNPDYMFKIVVNNLSSNHLQWQASKGNHSTKFAFYAARVEHLHSLIHLGLYPFRKVAGPQGTGIYLTSDLKLCLESSPPNWVWGKSVIGTQLQTVAVVEFIASDPNVMEFHTRDSGHCDSRQYFVPINNLIQARYILVFVRDTHQMPVETLEFLSKQNASKIPWKRVLLLGSYLAGCFLSWKTLKSTHNANIWELLARKFIKVDLLKKLVFPPELVNCMAHDT